MSAPLNPPAVRVSPLIRLCRWTLLTAGFLYGVRHFSTLQKKENEHRDYVEKMKPVWMEKKRLHVANANREELLYLAKETGTPIPNDFDKQYPPSK